LKRPDATVVPYGYMEHMQSLKETDGRAMWAMGGEWLAAACVEAGLLGTTETVVMPIVLGNVFKLFVPSNIQPKIPEELGS
jgi:dihydrofolate reductase